MSLDSYVAIDNAEHRLRSLLPAYAAGQLSEQGLHHVLGVLFRQLGTCRMLVEGIAEPLFISQMQAASVYSFRLASLPEDEKATSLSACWWDAVAGGYWDAAREIAIMSRATYNPKREHEDDFLYDMYVMQRYFLAPDKSDTRACEAHEEGQERRLERWEAVLEGAADPKLDLCRALQGGDAGEFQQALLEVGRQRNEWLDRKQSQGKLGDEYALWTKPVWPQGLGLLRLAESDGLGSGFECPDVPPLLRIDPPFRYDPDAWRSLDFQPSPRD